MARVRLGIRGPRATRVPWCRQRALLRFGWGPGGSGALRPTIPSKHFLGAGQIPGPGTNRIALACVWATEAAP